MSKAIKIIMVIAIVFSLLVFTMMGVYLKNDMEYNIQDLNNKLLVMDKKREYLTEQTINLMAVKKNLANEIAKESDKAQQEELQKQLISLSEQQKLATQQKIAQEQARIDTLRQQQLQAQLAAQAAAKTVTKSTSSSSTKSSTTTTTTTATPTPKPTPVKTRAS